MCCCLCVLLWRANTLKTSRCCFRLCTLRRQCKHTRWLKPTLLAQALTNVIKRSKATTMMGLEKELKEAAAALERCAALSICALLFLSLLPVYASSLMIALHVNLFQTSFLSCLTRLAVSTYPVHASC